MLYRLAGYVEKLDRELLKLNEGSLKLNQGSLKLNQGSLKLDQGPLKLDYRSHSAVANPAESRLTSRLFCQ